MHTTNLNFLHHRFGMLLVLTAFLLTQSPVKANDSLTLVIQPIYGMDKTHESFQPLASYLSHLTGKNIDIKTYPNFITYWNETRDGQGYDLILDAAHFTGYRAKELDFEILAKIPGTVSYSVIVPDSTMVIDIDELVGKKIATLGPPSMGAAKVSLLFDNPLRQPFIYETENSEKALDLLFTDEVDAAIIPTPLVGSLTAIAVVTTTDPTQHIALSASPRLDANLRLFIRDALIHAAGTQAGKQMLRKIGFAGFENPDTERYVMAADLLQLTGLD
ncbi:MAG: PhnD/SsuA/transferrin family substrate-binding protein [Pseudomonadota bacterium]|nr:PhnD/SsuA/transferrin family substrate-binding protein [Pseudomonadota bacterium]